MRTLGKSHTTSFTTESYFRTNYTIFEYSSQIDEDIATEDALDINGDEGDSDVKVDEFQLHMNANETEYSVEDDAITCEENVEKGSDKKILKAKACGSMQVIGKITVDNSMSFEGVKIPITPDSYVPSGVNNIKGETAFESMDNLVQWS